jgi:hypothetical protein
LMTLNAINAMQSGKALPKGAPSMEVRLPYWRFSLAFN